MDLAEKQLSPESKIKVELSAGKILVTGSLDTAGIDASLTVSVDAEYFFDELAKKIPGTFDDALLGIIKGAVKAL